MRYSLEFFYVAFIAGYHLDLNLKYMTSKAVPLYVSITQSILPMRV